MKFSITLGLVLVSSVLALPRYSSRPEKATISSTGPKRGSSSNWYDVLVVMAGAAFDRTIMPYLASESALALPVDTTCAPGFSFNPHSMACELPGHSVPPPSHPDGHGKCLDGQFWFGPKQTCVGGRDLELAKPPVGYYCPLNWSFSNKHRCCVPNTPAVITRNSCKNGNGTWDLIRIVCTERPANLMD
ncbi:hypothetical protein FS749_001079 [Ceratobasidium sp. UAMH 11750]|nr:hypothetical protein FS749_001079 [Ceratobasidium sp. UAMH 11750]